MIASRRRLARLPGQPEEDSAEHPERGRNNERLAREPRQRTAQPVDVDLQPGQEQQHAKAQLGQDLHRRVDTRPAEDRRADDDAGDDHEHRARHGQPGQQAEHDRDEDRDRGDDQDAIERQVEHAVPPEHLG